jgi:hypothetical protein
MKKKAEDYVEKSNGKFKAGNPGKPKGAKNKQTLAIEKALAKPFVSVKHAILEAYNDPRIGGTEGLILWVLEFPSRKKIFYNWIMRLLPKTLDIAEDPANSALQQLLDKYKDLNAQDLRARAAELAAEVTRACGDKSGS